MGAFVVASLSGGVPTPFYGRHHLGWAGLAQRGAYPPHSRGHILQESPLVARSVPEVPMEMPKASDADKARFRSLVPDLPEVVIKPMFGNLGAFVNGNMFAGLFGPTIGVKLSETDKTTLERTEPTVPFGPAERPMGGWTGLPETWSGEGDDAEARARAWVEKSFEHVAGLPPKAPKAPRVSKK